MKPFSLALMLTVAAAQACGGEIYQDFRDKDVDVKLFRRAGEMAGERIRTEPLGLRITLPADPVTKTLGLNTRAPTKGDFEITVGYEILQAERPKTGSGLGLEIYVNTDTPTQEALVFYHMVKPKEGEVYICDKKTTTKEGKRDTTRKVIPAETRSGHMRITRKGMEVAYFAAEGNAEEYKELCKYQWDTMDIKGVAVRAWGSQNVVDLRITEIRIRDELDRAAAKVDAKNEGPQPAEEIIPAAASRLLWVMGVLVGVMLLVLPMLVIAVMLLKGKRSKGKAASDAAIAFFCSGCGKSLKTKVGSVGKTVKCPKCGIAVPVPAKVA